ncbi:SDR family oxidoreductase [Mycetohabitans sp. B4]|nr:MULTISPECIES: SDR family oxidoreductase [Burkholderiaceae]MCG1018305.1 SDR family oxidoreductase [Mycetohabitans sp. B4]
MSAKPPDQHGSRNQPRLALGHYARPDEIADVALLLARARASYVTGALVLMDGGSAAVT